MLLQHSRVAARKGVTNIITPNTGVLPPDAVAGRPLRDFLVLIFKLVLIRRSPTKLSI